ncbi:protein NRT1/ PTR FAMILY 5.10-like [Iris pallida]|uniref:Protein NRT1/ PTR FAMILY 5.10-like n=1 Tax=Iris pallida TaxID=29817 RepID=A0AAX6FTU5_IRIPA|nr:protein NRT1/ PTR FAMILY 5.10-like [Iris pallida]
MVRGPLHHRSGDSREGRVLRDSAEPDHLPDGPPPRVHRVGRGIREHVVGSGVADAAARRLRRGILPRPVPDHRRLVCRLCAGLGLADTLFRAADTERALPDRILLPLLYLVAFAQGGHKPCVQAFGADQFDENDPEESAARSSFFNWWYFGLTAGTVASVVVLSYVQDNVGWGLGFGVPCVLMAVALVAFLAGTRTYRYHLLEDESPFSRIGKTFLVMARGWLASRRNKNRGDSATPEGAGRGQDQAAADQSNNIKEDGHEPSPQQIEEARGVLRLFPIWTTCLIYAVVFAQSSTFFTKQGSTMDRRIGSSFRVRRQRSRAS